MTWLKILKSINGREILLVENNKNRIIETLKLCNVKYIASTEKDLCSLIDKPYTTFSVLMIDYDFGCILTRNNSYDVLRSNMQSIKNKGVKVIIIHSWNPWGRIRLKRLFVKHGFDVIIKRHWRVF